MLTEKSWLACTDPDVMRLFLFGRTSDRKMRLFACACARQDRKSSDIDELKVIEVAERLADGLATEEEVCSARSANDAFNAAAESVKHAVQDSCDASAAAAGKAAVEAARLVGVPPEHLDSIYDSAFTAELAELARLMRHIVGNPFRPYPVPSSWPVDVVHLAEALYGGADAAFALADALLEAGHPELAEHLRQEAWHPKGCWAIDVITGRK